MLRDELLEAGLRRLLLVADALREGERGADQEQRADGEEAAGPAVDGQVGDADADGHCGDAEADRV